MKYLLLLAMPLLLLSCFEEGDCSDVSSNVMRVNFFSFGDKKTKTLLIDSIKMEGYDTVMYDSATVSAIALPVNPTRVKMTYRFYYQSTIATLDVSYSGKTFALAPDCAAIAILTLSDATATVIKDIVISLPDLTSHAEENIKLYF